MTRQLVYLYAVLVVAVVLNVATWVSAHRTHPVWPNVPMPPSERSVVMSFLGDREMAYRSWAMILQNFGNAGGQYRPLKDYDYTALGAWFNLLDDLNPRSDMMPFMVSYYFGATQNPEQLPPVIAYLEKVGVRPNGWRWMIHAVYLARHRMQNMDEALRLAKKMGETYQPGMPAWTLQMQALISADMGDKEAAYSMLKAMIATESDKMDPVEVNFMVDYICTKILTPAQAPHEPMCKQDPAPAKTE